METMQLALNLETASMTWGRSESPCLAVAEENISVQSEPLDGTQCTPWIPKQLLPNRYPKWFSLLS